MLIALDDPLWSRLYTAYGVVDTAGSIRQLRDDWDVEVLKNLCWESLYHQGTLYPATYAALPWLMQLRPEQGCLWSAMFFSAVLESSGFRSPSVSPDAKGDACFDGLSTQWEDHQHEWLAEEQRLSDADMEVLAAVAENFARDRSQLAAICVAEAERSKKAERPYLLNGPKRLLKDTTLSLPDDARWPHQLRSLERSRKAKKPDEEGQGLLFG